MKNFKVLDCTLRDGGYVNDWNFGAENIDKILVNLSASNLDFIEFGFLGKNENNNKTIYKNFDKIKDKLLWQNLCLMLNYGEYNIENLTKNYDKNLHIRLAFKKKNFNDALTLASLIKDKGYGVFINPMVTEDYSDSELLELIKKVNKIKPVALTIADTLGDMVEADIEKMFGVIDHNLGEDIALCFHSHNNMQKSFSNAQMLMKLCDSRELIIDSCVFGMGRGAGNLCTELITQEINKNIVQKYDISKILAVAREFIMPIYEKKSWGVSVEYYLSALNHCHPNYVKFLKENKGFSSEKISELLQAIPLDRRANFSVEVLENLL